jgi:hypothetical protein
MKGGRLKRAASSFLWSEDSCNSLPGQRDRRHGGTSASSVSRIADGEIVLPLLTQSEASSMILI